MTVVNLRGGGVLIKVMVKLNIYSDLAHKTMHGY